MDTDIHVYACYGMINSMMKSIPETQERRTCTSCRSWDTLLPENAFYADKTLKILYI